MIFGVSHVVLQCRNLAAAEEFWVGGLGFSITANHNDWIDIDACGVTLRLEEATIPMAPTRLRLQVAEVRETVNRLQEAGGSCLSKPQRTNDLALEATCTTPGGHHLVLWRRLRECEYGFVPPLPTQSEWTVEAVKTLQELLESVPETFRAAARKGATQEAETLCWDKSAVGLSEAVRALIRTTPRPLRDRVRTPLIQRGIDPDQFRPDFES